MSMLAPGSSWHPDACPTPHHTRSPRSRAVCIVTQAFPAEILLDLYVRQMAAGSYDEETGLMTVTDELPMPLVSVTARLLDYCY